MVAITLTQDSFRLWARIGYVAGLTLVPPQLTDVQVAAQLAQLDANSVANQYP